MGNRETPVQSWRLSMLRHTAWIPQKQILPWKTVRDHSYDVVEDYSAELRPLWSKWYGSKWTIQEIAVNFWRNTLLMVHCISENMCILAMYRWTHHLWAHTWRPRLVVAVTTNNVSFPATYFYRHPRPMNSIKLNISTQFIQILSYRSHCLGSCNLENSDLEHAIHLCSIWKFHWLCLLHSLTSVQIYSMQSYH